METFYFVYNKKKIYLHIEKDLLVGSLSFELNELLSIARLKKVNFLLDLDIDNHIFWIKNVSEEKLSNYLFENKIKKEDTKVFLFNSEIKDFNKIKSIKINPNNFYTSELKYRRKIVLNESKTLSIKNKKTILPTKVRKLIRKILPKENTISKENLLLKLIPEKASVNFGRVIINEKFSKYEESILLLSGIKIVNSRFFENTEKQFENARIENNNIQKELLNSLFNIG